MAQINLLPKELRPKAYIVTLSKTLNKIAIIAITVVLVTAALLLATYLFYFKKNSKLVSEQNRVASEIKALQSSEQRLVLVKDRIGKLEKVFNLASASDEIEPVEKVLSLFPPSMILKNSSLGEGSILLQVSSPNLEDMSVFLASITKSDIFKIITLKSFELNQIEGYVLELELK